MFRFGPIAAAGAACVALVVAPLPAQQVPPAGAGFVYLNSQEILTQAPGSADAQRTFERELSEMQAELQSRAAVLDSLVRDYQRQEVLLSPQAREEKQGEIRTRQQELQSRRAELDSRARQRQQELLKPILDRVSALIEQIRRENRWSMVFDVSTEGVVAADPNLDITALVVDRLKQGASDTAQAPAASDTAAGTSPAGAP